MSRTLIYVVYHDQGDLLLEALGSIDVESGDVDCVVINTSSTEESKTYLNNVVPSRIPIKQIPGNLIQVIASVYATYLEAYEFIVRLDADDRFEPGGLKKLMTFMWEQPNCAAVYGDWKIINEDGETRGAVLAPRPETYQGFHGACTMFRTKYLKKYEIDSYGISCQDGFCTYLYLKKNNLFIGKIDGLVFQYRRHQSNLSHARDRLWAARTTLLRAFADSTGRTRCIFIDCTGENLGERDQEFIRQNCTTAICGDGQYLRREDGDPIAIPRDVRLTDFFAEIEGERDCKILSVNVKKIGTQYFDGLIEIFVRSAVLQRHASVGYGTVFSRRIWLNTISGNDCVNLLDGATVPSFLECAGLSYFDNAKDNDEVGVVTDYFLTDFIDRTVI